MSEKILVGDALERLRELPDESVHTCVTSPPYYNLRDYGTAGQIGTEDTVEEYIDRLVAVFREVRRVLRPDGTLWVVIGDSYATKSGSQPPTNTRNSCGHTAKHPPRGYKCKDLIGVPWQLAFALRADGLCNQFRRRHCRSDGPGTGPRHRPGRGNAAQRENQDRPQVHLSAPHFNRCYASTILPLWGRFTDQAQ